MTTRAENKKSQSKPVEVNLLTRERFCLVWTISQIQGVNEGDALHVVGIQEALDIEDAERYPDKIPGEQPDTYELSPLQLKWILKEVQKRFDAAGVPPMWSGPFLNLKDRLRDALDDRKFVEESKDESS